MNRLAFQQKKAQGEKLLCLTCYDYSTARILDETDVDLLLVGDSLAMTMLGHPNTVSVTVDEMLHHVKAVTRGAKRAWVIADMPFMSYGVDLATGAANAARFMQEGGAGGVKVEGASDPVLALVERLVSLGVPVMGHLGFTPQFVHQMGGFRVQGKTPQAAKALLDQAQKLQAAGVFGVVLEMVPAEVAEWVTRHLTVPTIGIGAGSGCDGQILVIDDLLGRYPDFTPKFVRPALNLQTLIKHAVGTYVEDVRAGRFPDNTQEAFSADMATREALA
jgi:3-methyl-2-oxobutanoate hydroxymethyltransferase